MDDYYRREQVNETAITFNAKEIVIPFYRVGVPEIDLMAIWQVVGDFRSL